MTNILAIDHGEKHIGLAWMQDGFDIILPFGIVKNKSVEIIPDALVKIIKDEHIDQLVLGLPLSLNGDEQKHAQNIRIFGTELTRRTAVPIVYIDERFTSYQADAMGGNVTRDEKSAMLLLETYKEQKS